MKKIIEKIKAWFKAIDWKKVGCDVLMLIGVGLLVSLLKETFGRLTVDSLNDPDYGMKLWRKAVEEFTADGGVEKFNEKWSKDHPEFDCSNEDHIQAQADAVDEMLKPYLDKVAKENAIGGYMLDFDLHEPVVFEPVKGHENCYKPEIHATIKKID